MLIVTLFTKVGCGLCDEVKAHLQQLHTSYPHELQEVNITEDDALYSQYRYTIPVVQIGEQELVAPITAVQLQNALQAAS